MATRNVEHGHTICRPIRTADLPQPPRPINRHAELLLRSSTPAERGPIGQRFAALHACAPLLQLHPDHCREAAVRRPVAIPAVDLTRPDIALQHALGRACRGKGYSRVPHEVPVSHRWRYGPLRWRGGGARARTPCVGAGDKSEKENQMAATPHGSPARLSGEHWASAARGRPSRAPPAQPSRHESSYQHQAPLVSCKPLLGASPPTAIKYVQFPFEALDQFRQPRFNRLKRLE